MLAWVAALVVGSVLVALQYARRAGPARAVLPAALRGVAATLITALALDAPVGRARRVQPLVALDA